MQELSRKRKTMLSFQPPAVGEEEIEAVARTIRSGWLTTGPNAAELERRFAGAPELRRYDLVMLDCPPSFSSLTLTVLRAVHEIVIPVPLTFLALDGCAQLMQTIQTVRTRYGHTRLRISMVVPTFYRRTRLAGEVLEQLKSRFPKEIAQTVVGFHVKIDEAQSRGLSVFEYAPRDRGAHALPWTGPLGSSRPRGR